MEIFFDKERQEFIVILGYGISNHLSLGYLQEQVDKISTIFPKMTKEEMQSILFYQIPHSRRYNFMWYANFKYSYDKETISESFTEAENCQFLFE